MLRKSWQLAKDRFELEVQERKADNERVGILTQSIASDEQRLKQLLGEAPRPGRRRRRRRRPPRPT